MKLLPARHAKRDDATAPSKQPTEPKIKTSTQAQIHYEALAESGLCWLGGNRYSVTLKLSDIDYQLAPASSQEDIIEKYARFLNGHLAGQHVQITLLNRVLDKRQLMRDVQLGYRGDKFDATRGEYNGLIAQRLETGRNNTLSEKYVTLAIEAETVEEAKIMLSRMVAEDASTLREVGGCVAEQIDGQERARLLQHMLRPGVASDFEYNELVGQAATTKDFVSPFSIDVSNHDRLTLSSGEERLWQTLVLRKLPPWMNDRVLKELAEIPFDLTVSLHLDPLDQAEGLGLVKRQIASMDMQRSTEMKKLAKQQLGEDFLPHELQASHAEAAELRDQLEQSNEKLFKTTIVVGVSAADEAELAEAVKRVRRVCGKHSCVLENLKYMQIDGLNALLPLGRNDLPIFRTLTTAVAAVMIPFTTQELLQPGGLFYGVNALSKNLIVADRTLGMNSNAFILGTTGSGKSQSAKDQITQTVLRQVNDEVLVIDPEREYVPLADELGAARVVISPGSTDCLNALALDKDVKTSDGDPISDKCTYVLSLCEVLLGGSEGLSASKRSIIDRAAQKMYRSYWASQTALPPTLATLYEVLADEPEDEAHEVATGLELYARGSAAGFARQTNVDNTNRVTVYDIADLGSDLQTFGMMVILEEVWARIARNRARGVRTWLYIDEFHLLFANDWAAEYCQSIFKRVRKWGASATGITQNIEELLANERARLMLSNSDGLFLLNQQSTDADALTELLKLSGQQRGYFTNVNPGCGLMRMGRVVIPFDNTMDPNSHIFKVFSTKFETVPEVSHA
ncbi:VirB4-like conjugal transfer ATPase, CD1110 family [Ancrocorticia populi]|uniref:Transfer complex protein n=1 Tax=Ancrocorticia populi TaxID=2175228 RepID=A0A2V1K6J4_9ACTO|nr:DUF87 domain-containing protein [Ancrocorticia populi]PWF27078.1 transfer complex protein [Ancrocorticia populi]